MTAFDRRGPAGPPDPAGRSRPGHRRAGLDPNDRRKENQLNSTPRIPEPATDRQARKAATKRVLHSAAGLGLLLLVAPLVAVLVMFGCGGEPKSVSSNDNGADVPSLVVSGPSAQTGASAVAAVQQGEAGGTELAAEELIPDLTISVEDTTVVPGESVEIVARGTEDVDRIVMYDGLHERRAFAFDSTTGLWKAYYRVPLQPRSPRIALSVTASNHADRWRRVWLFLNAAPQEAVAAPQPEPTTEK